MKPETKNPAKTPKQNSRSQKSKALITLIVLALIAGSGFGAYYWQHHKLQAAQRSVEGLNTQVTGLNTQVKGLQTQLSSLQTKYDQTQNTLNSYQNAANATQDHLELTVDGAQYVNPWGQVTAGGNWFGVLMTLKNTTTNPISYVVKDLELKTPTGGIYNGASYDGATTLPSGWDTLDDHTLAPGTSVTGVVIFQMPNKNVKSFTLINGSNSYPVGQ